MAKATWTDDQAAAIAARDANLLVAAAAGAGKTAVLVERIIRRVSDLSDPLDLDRLLVVTFTNAAAAEMRERIGHALAQALNAHPGSQHLKRQLALLGRASITTLHSFCLDILRQHFYLLELDPRFRIADETEVQLLRQEVLEELFEQRYAAGDAAFAALVESYGGERDDAALQALVLRLYDFSRSHPWPEAWLQEKAAAFRVEPGTPLERLPWGRSVIEAVRLRLRGAESEVEAAGRLALRPGGPSPYRDNLRQDMALVRELLDACDKSWSALYQAFQAAQFGRLKACKAGEVDDGLKERAKALRDGVKETVKELRQLYFERPPEQFLADLAAIAPLMQTLVQLVGQFEQAYRRAKRGRALVDFADLEHYCLQILRAPESTPERLVPSPVALGLRERLAEVLVDEYQDVNAVQEAILHLVSRQDDERRPNLFMVGDVKQSIYRFRLAEPGLFLGKYRSYTADGAAARRKIDLARNFRSRPEVVDAVNCVFRQIMTPAVGELAYDAQAELVCGAAYPPPPEGLRSVAGPAELHLIERGGDRPEAGDEGVEDGAPEAEDADGGRGGAAGDGDDLDAVQTEAHLVARLIQQLVAGAGMSGGGAEYCVYDKQRGGYRPLTYRDVVVLLRTTRGWANTFLDAFRQAGIPAYADLGSGYFDAVEVQTMLSLLHVIDNPRQDIPLAGVLRSPLVGLSAEALARVRLSRLTGDFYQALRAAAEHQELGPLAGRLQSFLEQLDRWRTLARRGSLAGLIWTIYRETGYYDYVGGMPGGAQRQANLRALHDRARQYEATSLRGLFRFLRFIERLQESGSDLGAARALGENEDVVRIMSIHKSKGLEFPVVIVAGLGKRFNFQDLSRDVLLHKDLGLGPDWVDADLRLAYPTLPKLAMRQKLRLEALAEELRVLYVALTRAREKLILTGSARGLERAAETWCRHLDGADWPLPDADLAAASTCLDWVAPALARHRDGAPLRHLAGCDGDPPGPVCQDGAQWQVVIWDAGSIQAPADGAAEAADADLLTNVRRLDSVAAGIEHLDLVARRLGWDYPLAALVGKPAKQAVTEIKRRFAALEQAEAEAEMPYRPAIVERPRFLQADQGLSSAERGSAVHLVMQHVDLSAAGAAGGAERPASWWRDRLRRQLAAMQERELLTSEQALAIDPDRIARFFVSPLGRRVLKAQRVHRELPFSLALPAGEVYPDLAGQDAAVLVQGVIDCLLDEGDGLVLIDYKTDRVSPAKQAEFVERYRGQLNVYARAVETILGRAVKERVLYFFHLDQAVRVG